MASDVDFGALADLVRQSAVSQADPMGARSRRKRKAPSKSDWKGVFEARNDARAGAGMTLDERLEALGSGGEKARRILRQIENSNVPQGVKEEARRRYRDGETSDKGLWSRVRGVAGDAVDTAFMVIDKPKRAVVATIEEAAELATGKENDQSWLDNFARAADYGTGDVINDFEDELFRGDFQRDMIARISGMSADEVDKFVESERYQSAVDWAKRGQGLVGDIALDPLTYVTAGATKGATAAGQGGRGAVRAEEAARLLDEAARATGDDALRQAANRVLESRSTLGLRGSELRAAGLDGGVQVFGRTVIPQDVVRAAGGRGVDAGKARIGGSRAFDALRATFGANGELRSAMRGGRAGAGAAEDPVQALNLLDSLRAEDLGKGQFGAKLGRELTDLRREFRSHKNRDIDSAAFTDALRQGADSEAFKAIDEATDGMATRFAGWFDRVYDEATARGVQMGKRDNYVARVLTSEGREAVGGSGARRRLMGRGTHEKRALRAGDEFMGVELTGDVPIETQVNEIAERLLGDDAVQLFSDDIEEIGAAYLRAMSNRVGEQDMWSKLRARGEVVDAFRPESIDELANLGRVRAADAMDLRGLAGDIGTLDAGRAAGAVDEAMRLRAGASLADDVAGTGGDQVDVLRQMMRDASDSEAVADLAGREMDRAERLAERNLDRFGDLDEAAMVADQGINDLLRQIEEAEGAIPGAQRQLDAAIDDRDLARKLGFRGDDYKPYSEAVRQARKEHGALVRASERDLPAKVEKKFATREVARQKVAEARVKYDVSRQAADMATADFNALADEYVALAEIGDQAAADVPGVSARRREVLSVAAEKRRQAAKVLRDNAKETDIQVRRIVAIEAAALEADAVAEEVLSKSAWLERNVRAGLRSEEGQRALRQLIDDAVRDEIQFFDRIPKGAEWTSKYGSGVVGEHIDGKALESLIKAKEIVAKDPNAILRGYDASLRGFKTFALLTPGYHVRNLLGGAFSNMVAGIDPSAYTRLSRGERAYRRVHGLVLDTRASAKAGRSIYKDAVDVVSLSAKEQADYGIVKQLHDGGLLDDTSLTADFSDNPAVERFRDVRRFGGSKRRLTDNEVTRLSRYTGDKTEDFLRGSLAFDRLAKGQSFDAAMDDVYHFHFNYGDLSEFERGTMRRVVPFWTWQSRNFARTAHYIAANPKAYQRWNVLRDNLDGDRDSEAYKRSREGLPDYLGGIGQIPIGDDGKFLHFDAGFTATDETLNNLGAAALVQDAAPIPKTIIESAAGKNMFSGAPITQEEIAVPDSWAALGLDKALLAVGVARRDPKHGHITLSDEEAYAIEQNLPLLGRIRRLFPSEDKHNDKATTAFLSFLGLGSRTATDGGRNNEMYRRADTLQDLKDKWSYSYEIGER